MEIDNRLYYQISAWMINDLHLKGKELQCYAVIYSLSQLGQGWFNAGLEYLAKFMQVSQPTASSAVDGLLKKGLIDKKQIITDTGRRVVYFCTNQEGGQKESYRGVNKNFMDGVNKNLIDPNKYNISNNKNKENIKEKRLSNDNQKSADSFEVFWKVYHKGGKAAALKAWNKLSENEREKATQSIDDYLLFCKRSDRPRKDTSTYLSQKCFNDDWKAVPDCYDIKEYDDDRVKGFKTWICNKYPDLIYHRNPLTLEQALELFDEYERTAVEFAMSKLCERNIHQYYNIKSGIKQILDNEQMDEL